MAQEDQPRFHLMQNAPAGFVSTENMYESIVPIQENKDPHARFTQPLYVDCFLQYWDVTTQYSTQTSIPPEALLLRRI